MAYEYSDLVAQAKRWAEQAVAAGWLQESAKQQLLDIDLRTPASLFNAAESRPLIVAFMGGTGVGKSSLLNRLAGAPIAKAGVERPTSKEVTLYHHRNVLIQYLPELPLAQINIAQHNDVSQQAIIWMDMPDFDSTEQANKHQVLQWLPHIDVLIYVVSPERYRDEKAWRLLLSESGKHAWLFVLNQWDRGFVEQYADFRQQLYKAGFVDPIIFTSSCAETIATDEFQQLQEAIVNLANNHVVQQLEQRGRQAKRRELKQHLLACQNDLGTAQTIDSINELWSRQWQRTSAQLQQGFAWPMQKLAQFYADHAADLIGKSVQPQLWDAWAQARLDDALDEVVGQAGLAGIPVTPYKQQLTDYRDKAGKLLQNQTELAVREALVNPGNILQRLFLKLLRFCEIVLPLMAIFWVAYQVFMGYFLSNQTSSHYLGVDFAIHSGLLIAISWLLPFFMLKKLQPSLNTSALRGLNKGLNNSLAALEVEIAAALKQINQQHAQQQQQLNQIINNCDLAVIDKPAMAEQNPLKRMLVD